MRPPIRAWLSACALATLLVSPAVVVGQQPPALRGYVRTADGRAIPGANVFVIETLDGVVTGDDGRFSIPLQADAAAASMTLVVRRLGFQEARRTILAAGRDSILVELSPAATSLAPMTVQAGAYTASAERGATLTPLEVVTTPGTAADVNRAIQALPGVQAVDEGTGLFVRGGDFTETKVFLNDAVMLNGVQLISPSGTFVGTVDPFLLDGIFFSSGGFGARYGDVLSGVAGLRTLGRPTRPTFTAGAGLAAFSADVGAPLSKSLGVRVAGNRFRLDPVLRVNGSTRDFDPAPNGYDASASVIATYRGTGEVKAFAIRQTNALGLGVDDASFAGRFNLDVMSDLGVMSWHDLFGRVRTSASLSSTALRKTEDYGVFRLRTTVRQQQLFSSNEWSPRETFTLRVGGEIERTTSAFEGSVPATGSDVGPGARTRVVGSTHDGDRIGAYTEADWRAGARTRLVLGLRTDHSSLTDQRTLDPRLSTAITMMPGVTLTAAWGIYHQVPDPLYFDPGLGGDRVNLPSMRATQAVVGLQAGSDAEMVRVELFDKAYDDLAQRTRDYEVVSGGTGRARGADIFLKGGLPFAIRYRTSISVVSSRRTDPNTGVMARAPFDITTSATAVIERSFGMHWHLATAYRSATGRPYTPVAGATFDSTRQLYTPSYGAPMSERFPAFCRLDLSASWLGRFSGRWQTVVYVALSNVLDRVNVQGWTYSSDYTQKLPVQSIFNRSLYFGTSITRFQE